MEKFVMEYALDRLARMVNNPLMDSIHKVNKVNGIVNALNLYQRGIITTDEAIKLILEA